VRRSTEPGASNAPTKRRARAVRARSSSRVSLRRRIAHDTHEVRLFHAVMLASFVKALWSSANAFICELHGGVVQQLVSDRPTENQSHHDHSCKHAGPAQPSVPFIHVSTSHIAVQLTRFGPSECDTVMSNTRWHFANFETHCRRFAVRVVNAYSSTIDAARSCLNQVLCNCIPDP
jgi:hypothetical protein